MHQVKKNPIRRPVRVVIIDRHVLFAEGLQALLEVCDEVEAVSVATSGYEAPSEIELTEPDVILVDPWLDGEGPFAILRTFRNLAPLAAIVFLEDDVQEVHVRLALKLRVQGFLTKSCRFSEIREAIQGAVRGSPAFCDDVRRYVLRTNRGPRFNRAASSSPLGTLTKREVEVMQLLARGFSVRDVAQRLDTAVSTIDNHKSRLMRKLGIHKVVDLATMAMREGLVS